MARDRLPLLKHVLAIKDLFQHQGLFKPTSQRSFTSFPKPLVKINFLLCWKLQNISEVEFHVFQAILVKLNSFLVTCLLRLLFQCLILGGQVLVRTGQAARR